jgi:hypothetical protein
MSFPGFSRVGRRRPSHVLVALVVLLLAGAAAGCRGNGKATLSHLTGVEELKARFNRDAGKPRMVLLVSPT